MTAAEAAPYGFLQSFPRERTYILPALHLLHEQEGYLSRDGLSAIGLHFKVPNSELYGIARSYSEFRTTPPVGVPVSVCTGIGCRLNGAVALKDSLAASLDAKSIELGETPCRFLCDLAPVVAIGHGYVVEATPEQARSAIGQHLPPVQRPTRPASVLEVRRVTGRCGVIDPTSLAAARAAGSYEGLAAARRLSPAEVTASVLASGLQGRGGAYFPAGRKWDTARAYPAPRYLVVNAEEGEPGVFKDRYLIENDPHVLVESLLIAAHAVEAERVFVYLNGEAALAANRLEGALAEAEQAGLMEATAVEVRRGAGGYVCGEESVILSSIEGDRAVPRLRPPLPVEAGLWGRPTVINNVETLANLPYILRGGPEAFRAIGTESHPGTKIICLSGAISRPGVYEVPFGTPMRAVLEDLGGGPPAGRKLVAVVCGGPSGGLLPASKFDTPIAGGALDSGGAALGAGGIVVIDDSMPVREVVYHLAAYNAAESCGKCTPCREGAPRMRDLIGALGTAGAPANAIELLDLLDEALANASLCGLGQLAPLPYRSARTHFLDDLTRP